MKMRTSLPLKRELGVVMDGKVENCLPLSQKPQCTERPVLLQLHVGQKQGDEDAGRLEQDQAAAFPWSQLAGFHWFTSALVKRDWKLIS